MIVFRGQVYRDNRYVYMAHDCFYVRCNDSAGAVGMFVVKRLLLIIFLSFGVVKYDVCLCSGCVVVSVWSCRFSCIESIRVFSCRCCMFFVCVHPVAVLNAVFCMTCSFLILVEDKRGDHMEKRTPEPVSCVLIEMLCMCVLYMSFGSKVNPRTFVSSHVYGSVVYLKLQILYSAGSGANRMQVGFFWI